MLSQHHNISLEQLFEFSLGSIPWSLATADSGLVKTDKAQLMSKPLLTTQTMSHWRKLSNIMDGNALMQSLTHLPHTFRDLAMLIFTCLLKSDTVHFVTDTCLENSIKQLERARCGSSAAYITGVSKTKLPPDISSQLRERTPTDVLLAQRMANDHYAQQLQGRNVYFVLDDWQWACILVQ